MSRVQAFQGSEGSEFLRVCGCEGAGCTSIATDSKGPRCCLLKVVWARHLHDEDPLKPSFISLNPSLYVPHTAVPCCRTCKTGKRTGGLGEGPGDKAETCLRGGEEGRHMNTCQHFPS